MKEARLLAKEALDAQKCSDAQVEALKKELKAAQDDAVRARLRGASLFEDSMNQKKEYQELKKKHEAALTERPRHTIYGRASTCSSASSASWRRRSSTSKPLHKR